MFLQNEEQKMKKYFFRNLNNCEEKYKKIIFDKLENMELISYIKPSLNYSKENKLPQFIFMFSNSHLIGYLLLMKNSHDNINDHSWLACHNADELSTDEALILLKEGIKICEACGANKLLQYLTNDMNFYSTKRKEQFRKQ